jgi:sugar O-acyltransferase (sialic acid O-acetyltransferase NeuD family)
MKKSLVIFGTGDIAQLAYFYFSRDTEYQIEAFTADANYISEETFCGLPVIPFEGITEYYPPYNNDFFVALSYSNLNALRKEKYISAKSLGYRFASFISAYATILNDGRIGENCFIFEDNTVQPFVTIGNNVTLWSGNHIGHHSIIKDHCFIASHVVVSGHVEIEESCFIGVNATLRDHIKVGANCIIGAGALILKDTEREGVYKGTETKRADIQSKKISRI